MSDAPVPKRWRFRLSCLGMLGIGVASLAILIGIVGVWSSTTGDLKAVDARATAMGLPLTWDEVGLIQSPPTVLDDWRRLQQLAASVKSYRDRDFEDADAYEEWPGPRVGVELPAAVRSYHTGLPQVELAELLGLCDRFRPVTVIVRTTYDPHTSIPEIETGRKLGKLLDERLALAPTDEVVVEARRMAHLFLAVQAHTAIQGLMVISYGGIWASALTRRLPDLTDREEAARLVDEVRCSIWSGIRSSCRGEFILWRGVVQALAQGDARYADVGSMLFGFPRWLNGHGLHRPLLRYVRRWLLDSLLDQVAIVEAGPDAPAMATALRASASPSSRPPPLAAAKLGNFHYLASAGDTIGWMWIRVDTQLAVLAAELRGQPWPADPTDPTGGRVRPILRDGHVIGFYLLGQDGKDGGGKGDDKAYALYEALAKP